MQVWNIHVWIWREGSFKMPSKHWHSFYFSYIRGSPFSIAVPFFNLLKLLTGIFCQTLQWTWHFSILKRARFLKLSWTAASVIIPWAACSLPQGGGSMMSIFRSSSDMWCHKSFAQNIWVAAFVGHGMCGNVWHIVAWMSPTARYWGLPYALCNALSCVLSWQKWSNYSFLASRCQVDAASQEFLREETYIDIQSRNSKK